MRWTPRLLLPVALAALAGCVDGPFFGEPLTLPHATGPAPTRVFVDSMFFQVQRVPGAPANSVAVVDITDVVAQSPAQSGLRAEVRRFPKRIQAGEVIVRGYVFNNGVEPGSTATFPFMITILSAFLIGGFFPYPVPVERVCKFRFQVNVSRPGELVYFHKGSFEVTYQHHFLWTLFGNSCGGGGLTTAVSEHLAQGILSSLY